MGSCGSKSLKSDVVEASVPVDKVDVESKNATTETDSTLTQEKEEGEKIEDSSEVTKIEPTPEAVKAEERASSETEPSTQETAPVDKTDEAPLVIL